MYGALLDALLFFIGGGVIGTLLTVGILIPEIDGLRDKLHDLKAENIKIRDLLHKAGVTLK